MPKVKSDAVTGLMTNNTMVNRKRITGQTMVSNIFLFCVVKFEFTQINMHNYQELKLWICKIKISWIWTNLTVQVSLKIAYNRTITLFNPIHQDIDNGSIVKRTRQVDGYERKENKPTSNNVHLKKKIK